MRPTIVAAFAACTVLASSALALAQVNVKGDPVDRAELEVDAIPTNAPIYIKDFSTAGATLGTPKHEDTAERLVEVIPHLLTIDMVEALRARGFDAQMTAGDSIPDDALVLTGRFTELNPGNQTVRVWIGFGAGKSRVCIDGNVSMGGSSLGEFSHCRAGLGWGESKEQVANSADRMADRVAELFARWSSGELQ